MMVGFDFIDEVVEQGGKVLIHWCVSITERISIFSVKHTDALSCWFSIVNASSKLRI